MEGVPHRFVGGSTTELTPEYMKILHKCPWGAQVLLPLSLLPVLKRREGSERGVRGGREGVGGGERG